MVSFIKKINEKSKELKEISKIYYNTANNLFKYINENRKKNITNTDKKIKEINKQIASIDDKIKSAIEELIKEGTKTMYERNIIFTQSLNTIQKDIKKIGFSEEDNCLESFLIGKKLINEGEIEKNTKEENNLQINLNKRELGTKKDNLKINFKEGGEYNGTEEDKSNFNPSKGISEVLIVNDTGNKNTSDFTSTDIFNICCFLNSIYTLLTSKIKNINDSIEIFCKEINDFISNLISNEEYSIEEMFEACFSVKKRWPNYETLEDNEKQKIENYLNALLDELKSLNGDIIKVEDVKISETNSIENNVEGENFFINDNVINIHFHDIFNVNDFGGYVFEGMRRFKVATFSGIEGISCPSGTIKIPNIFYKKKFGILIDGSYYGCSLENILTTILATIDSFITLEEFKTKVKSSI